MSIPIRSLAHLQDRYNLTFTPAGIWEMKEGRKHSINANRPIGADWDKYPRDNLGKMVIPKDILVLDIDGAPSTITNDRIEVDFGTLGKIELPLGLYTETTSKGKYHIYYRIDPTSYYPTKNGVAKSIDLRGPGGFIFEGHEFSPNYSIHDGEILPIPMELEAIVSYIKEKHKLKPTTKHLSMRWSIKAQRLIEAYLDNEIAPFTEDFRDLLIETIPKNYLNPDLLSRKPNLSYVSLKSIDTKSFYSLINDTVYKLVGIYNLGWEEHSLPFINKLLDALLPNRNITKTEERLANITYNLDLHPPYSIGEDAVSSLDEAIEVFDRITKGTIDSKYVPALVTSKGQIQYVLINKHTRWLYITEGGEYLFSASAALRIIGPRMGNLIKSVAKDNDLSGHVNSILRDICTRVDLTYRAWKPGTYINDDGVLVINISKPSQYMLNAEPRDNFNHTLLYRFLRTTLNEQDFKYYIWWLGQLLFGDRPPVTVPFMHSEKQGTGKTLTMMKIPEHLLGPRLFTSINEKNITANYSVKDGFRLYGMDEARTTPEIYNFIKEETSATNKTSTFKFEVDRIVTDAKAFSLTANEVGTIDKDDRRFYVIEPAHLDDNYPYILTDGELANVSMMLNAPTSDRLDDIQALADYVLYIYNRDYLSRREDDIIRLEFHRDILVEAPSTLAKIDLFLGSNTTDSKKIEAIVKQGPEIFKSNIITNADSTVGRSISEYDFKTAAEALPAIVNDMLVAFSYNKIYRRYRLVLPKHVLVGLLGLFTKSDIPNTFRKLELRTGIKGSKIIKTTPGYEELHSDLYIGTFERSSRAFILWIDKPVFYEYLDYLRELDPTAPVLKQYNTVKELIKD